MFQPLLDGGLHPIIPNWLAWLMEALSREQVMQIQVAYAKP